MMTLRKTLLALLVLALAAPGLAEAQKQKANAFEKLLTKDHVAAPGIDFDGETATLKSEAAPTLEALANFLKAHPETKVRIEVHRDDTGDAEADQALTEGRAHAVNAWLVDHGITDGRIVPVGLGASRPIAADTTAEERARNRRVEIWIIDD